MPPDPFAGDSLSDFLRSLPPLEEEPPLSDEERELIHEDLYNTRLYREELEPRGVKGIFFFCEDCGAFHYLDWDTMESDLESALADLPPVAHEPSAFLDTREYVSWDYCAGFVDGLNA
ncbi:MAG: DUF5319 family protein [Corynebacterium sp.]|nr:DUF5319 family protein [Corynebacterium sp.]